MKVVIANESHIQYAELICETIRESAKVRGTGIAERTPEYITKKISTSHA
ncbi:MAG: GNAT family N-acetyltransferase, partial [Lutibacter sp.]|nr:GNAT family N-acetyltransferase [Lutibacter sp.]